MNKLIKKHEGAKGVEEIYQNENTGAYTAWTQPIGVCPAIDLGTFDNLADAEDALDSFMDKWSHE